MKIKACLVMALVAIGCANGQQMHQNSSHAGELVGRRLADINMPLGMYGPITSVSTTFLATAIMFDLDFRKNWDAAVRTKYGEPIVAVPNLNADLRINLQIGTSNSMSKPGVETALDFFLGGNGLNKVVGLVGGYHSAISMPIANIAAVYEVPQVSWGSTSPKLSNKGTYPYFLRTIPPDSIQGGGMWKFIDHFKIPSVNFLYAKEPYGEGLFTTVNELATKAGQGTRINGIGVKYMPTTYDATLADAAVQLAISSKNVIYFLAFTTDQATKFMASMEKFGVLYNTKIQLVGSEAVKVADGVTPRPTAGLPAGFIKFNPVNKGTLFPKFQEMWLKMLADDVIGTAPTALYALDKFKVLLAAGVAPLPTNAMFANMDKFQLEDPFIFDAAYSFVIAINELLNAGTASADIKGKTLLDKVGAVQFEGISGTVKFNSAGDRLAVYNIDNFPPSSPTTEVTVAAYSAVTDTITMTTGQTMHWMAGTTGATLPAVLTDCEAGSYIDPTTRLCVKCSAGYTSAGGQVAQCSQCAAGKYAIAKVGASSCMECAPGNYSTPGSIGCLQCPTSKYTNAPSQAECLSCQGGKYQDVTGQTACKFRQIQLGVYGPITSISTTFLASAVAFDLDFRKNFEPDLVAKFGPPIVTIPKLNPSLRIAVQIGTSNSKPDVGVGTNADFFLGQNGLNKVAGIVGGYHSAISMPVATLATTYKVPQVSWGSTSPALSNKAAYPYFSRTIPPDSIQGAGMWKFITFFNLPSLTFTHSKESYGNGLQAVVSGFATDSGQSFRINFVGVAYMPDGYDLEAAQPRVDLIKKLGDKFIFIAMTSDQATPFLSLMETGGFFGTSYQLVGSEAVTLGGGSIKPKGPLPNGFMRFTPQSRGPLFPGFQQQWLKMKKDDVMGADAMSRYAIDKFKVPLSESKATLPTDEMFASMDAYQLEDPFLFDACYTFAVAFNELLNAGVDPLDIKEDALLAQIRKSDFVGISGSVSFNKDGDRLASYFIDNIQGGRRLSDGRRLAGTVKTVAVFSAATNLITIDTAETMLWMDGSTGPQVPASLVACSPGYEEEATTGMCVPCASGYMSLGGAGVPCDRCPAGKKANLESGATACLNCTMGYFAAGQGSTMCLACPPGAIAASTGTVQCTRCLPGKKTNKNTSATDCTDCDVGKYAGGEGKTTCLVCPPGTVTAVKGTQLCEKCDAGKSPNSQSVACSNCTSGKYAAETGAPECKECNPGQSSGGGAIYCDLCSIGNFQDIVGQSSCKQCESVTPGSTSQRGAKSTTECVCRAGTFRNGALCETCIEGLTCEEDGMKVPLQTNRFWVKEIPRADGTIEYSPYRCRDSQECPAGPVGTCASGRTEIACGNCIENYYQADEGECHECEGGDILPLLAVIFGSSFALIPLYIYAITDVSKQKMSSMTAALALGQMACAVQALGVFSELDVAWSEPITSVLSLLNLFTFDLEVIKIQCVFKKDDPVLNFLASLMVFPCFMVAVAVMIVFARVVMKKKHLGVDHFFNLVGLVSLVFYISVAIAVLRPLHCLKSPNGTSSMSSNPSVVCWDSDTHSALVALGVVGVLAYPILILTVIAQITFRYPALIASGFGLKLLVRYRFLFQRFRPATYYWGVCYVLRNFAIALAPVIFRDDALWQVFFIAIVLLTTLIASANLMPWRTKLANMTELFSTVGLAIFMQVAAFFVGSNQNEDILGVFLTIMVFTMLAVVLVVVIHSLYKRFFPTKGFGAFLCHHKESAGALARYSKNHMEKESGKAIFLDSDYLEDIESIFDIVRTGVKNLVILQTKMVLTRPWCAGEICTAVENKIPVVCVKLNDYEDPDDKFLASLDEIWSQQQRNHLMQFGCTLDKIKESFRALPTLPSIVLDRFEKFEEQDMVISEITATCKLVGMAGTLSRAVSTASPPKNSGSSEAVRIAFGGCMGDPETRCTAQIMLMMIMKLTRVAIAVVHTPEEMKPHLKSIDYFVPLLTNGLLQDTDFANVFVLVELSRKADPVELRPAMCDAGFKFPGPEYYAGLTARKTMKGDTLVTAYRRMLNVIALGFNPHGSTGIMGTQIAEIIKRMGKYNDAEKTYVVELVTIEDDGSANPIATKSEPEPVRAVTAAKADPALTVNEVVIAEIEI